MPCNCENDNGLLEHRNGCELRANRVSTEQNGYNNKMYENGSSIFEEVDHASVRLL